MIVYGLIGHPLEHSFSKAYFNAKFQREGLDCRYENFDLEKTEQASELFENHPEIMGCNVTSPYKESILDYIDGYNDIVASIKSANTLLRMADGRILGFNTDVVGFATLFDWICHSPEKDSALILGTGGASKAVQYVLRGKGIPYKLVSRDPQRGDYTYRGLDPQGNHDHPGRANASTVTPEVIQSHRILINATPLGTYPHIETAPDLPYDALTPKHLLIDLVYNPEETRFLHEGRQRGATTCNGLMMLHAQAEASWKIWGGDRLEVKGER